MKRFSIWTVGMALSLALTAPVSTASAQGYTIVVNDGGPATLSRDEVSRIFLKKSTKLTPVDQNRESKVRAVFSKAVLGRPITAIVSYWQQQIFSGGDSPPVEKGSDADVLAYVRANPKAIGYVAAGTDLGSGVRAVTVQ